MLEDEASGLEERDLVFNLWTGFPSQGNLSVSHQRFQEVWLDRELDGSFVEPSAGVQATMWLRLDLYEMNRSIFLKASYRWRR